MSDQDNNAIEVDNSVIGKLKITGQTVLVLLCLVAAAAGAFGVYLHFEHEAKASVRETTLIQAIEKLANAQLEGNKIHNETNCLIGYQGPLEAKTEFCKRVTR